MFSLEPGMIRAPPQPAARPEAGSARRRRRPVPPRPNPSCSAPSLLQPPGRSAQSQAEAAEPRSRAPSTRRAAVGCNCSKFTHGLSMDAIEFIS